MKILAFDTSGRMLTVALATDGEIVLEKNRLAGREHARLLIPVIRDLLAEAELDRKDLDGLAVGLGPGSFTGLRIGIAAAKGFAFSCALPVVGVPTPDVIARNACFSSLPVVTCFDARKGNVYAGFFRGDAGGCPRRQARPLLLSFEKFQERVGRRAILLLGDAIDVYGDAIRRKNRNVVFGPRRLWMPRAGELALLAAERFAAGTTDDPEKLAPLYLYSDQGSITRKRKK